MSISSEFKAFVIRGNVIDMAVGVIMGGAFGKIVSSMVEDILMPPLGVMISGVHIKELKLQIAKPILDEAGKVTKEAVSINYGNFLQTTLDFLIISFIIFMVIKMINSLNRKEEAAVPPPPPPEPTQQEILLTEIRALLKQKGV